MEVEEGKRHWEGGLGYLREGESSRVCTDLHIAVCSLTGWEGRGGGAGCLCEALLALWDCKPSQAGKREELTRVGLGTSGFRTAAPGANLVRV